MEWSIAPLRRAVSRRAAGILIAGLLSVALIPAAAQAAGPSRAERGIVLTSPGVVFIDTSVNVKAGLTFERSANVSGLGHISRTYSFDYATGSGFVVNPGGAVVTASHVVEPDEQSIRNYAANKLVLEGYNYSYPSANSSPFEQYTLPVSYQNVLLQQCYKAVACDFTITPIITVFSAIDIAQIQLPKGMPARILTSTGFANTDVAILQVNGDNMPTVALASTASSLTSGDAITAIGFPGSSRDALQTGVTEPTKVFGHVSNIRSQGTSKLIEVDANIEPGESGGPAIDSNGRVIGLVSFSLLQSSGESGQKFLRTVDDIKGALSDAGVSAARGPVDSAFGKAMDLFWGNHFTAAVPELNRVLALYDGHPLAKQYLADAQAKKGTAADIPLSTGGGFPAWAIAAIAGGAVILVLVVVVASRRRRPAPAGAPMPLPVAAVVPQTPAPPRSRPGPSASSRSRRPPGRPGRSPRSPFRRTRAIRPPPRLRPRPARRRRLLRRPALTSARTAGTASSRTRGSARAAVTS